ncbi:MAG: DUF2911 domain-containing protein [Acidobacteriota bacterium]|nr:DUF2911 domain-containing protein [Acidobacteriota bacterium]
MRFWSRTVFLGCVFLSATLSVNPARGQQPASDSDRTTTYCDFADGNQLTVQYSRTENRDGELRDGRIWQPAGAPMILYVQTPLTFGDSQVPVGAFSLYVLPGRKQWTLIVNKNVSPGSNYDQKDDVARGAMEIGEVGDPVKPAQVSFAHTSPKGCSLQIYYGKAGAFGSEFREP